MADIFSEETDPARDLPRERLIEVPGASAFVLKQYDPHGFWKIHREHGQVPDYMLGEYTTVRMAREVIDNYIQAQAKKKK